MLVRVFVGAQRARPRAARRGGRDLPPADPRRPDRALRAPPHARGAAARHGRAVLRGGRGERVDGDPGRCSPLGCKYGLRVMIF